MKVIDLKGKIAVVTGGAGQLGRAMVRELAACGADVVIQYHTQKDFAAKLEDELKNEYGVRALALPADVTDLDSVMSMKKKINERLGKVNIIVNNAVKYCDWNTILDQDIKDYESQFKICVLQAVIMAKAFVPDMIERRYGRVIGINTECTMQLFPYQSTYDSGKRAMDAIYKVLAREVGEYNITVNQVAPGWTISDQNRDANGTESNTRQDFVYIDRVPMKRRGTDEDIANGVCFLASDLANFITGVFLPVCGGNVMPCV